MELDANIRKNRHRFTFTNNESGMVQVLEFIFIFTVFLLLLGSFYICVGSQFPRYDPRDIDSRIKVEEVSDMLIGDTGAMTNGDPHWDRYTKEELNHGNNTLLRLGLARDHDSYGVLSINKITALYEDVRFTKAVETLALSRGQLVNISIKSLDDDLDDTQNWKNLDFKWGATPTGESKDFVIFTRLVLIDWDDGSSPTTARLTVNLFYGGRSV